jgi:glycosyltransferase involved in cell wall biosynthesis
MFPLLSETYIADEAEALVLSGMEVAFCTEGKRSAPMPVDAPLFHDLDEAIDRFSPDVVLVNWMTFARTVAPSLLERGLPFACRAHSFDFSPDIVRELLASPACIGVWGFPHLAATVPGVTPMPSLFTGHSALRPAAAERDLVLSVSAGLPKKDWDLLLEAFEGLPGVDRRIVVGTTHLYESLPTDLLLRLQELPDPPLLQVNLTRDQVFELLARAAVLVYTLEPGQQFGNPNSIIEALCAGACVVTPRREEARQVVGRGFRGYDTAADIVQHVREVLAGGPAIDEERSRNREHGMATFADPLLGKRFAAELNEALTRWQERAG